MDDDDDEEEDDRDPNERRSSEWPPDRDLVTSARELTPVFAHCTAHTIDSRIQRDDEFSDSEDEGSGGRRDRTSHKTNGISKSKPSSKSPPPPAPTTSTGQPLTSDLITPSGIPPAPLPETVPGVAEGEDVEIAEYDGPQATTSAARATTTAEKGEDDALSGNEVGGEDVEMKD